MKLTKRRIEYKEDCVLVTDVHGKTWTWSYDKWPYGYNAAKVGKVYETPYEVHSVYI